MGGKSAGKIGVGGQHVTGQRAVEAASLISCRQPEREEKTKKAVVSQDRFLLVTFCICTNEAKKKRKEKAAAFGKIMSA